MRIGVLHYPIHHVLQICRLFVLIRHMLLSDLIGQSEFSGTSTDICEISGVPY
jgi:hypothetical protein